MPRKVLFISNQNLNRSRTAELLFKDRFNTRSAGLCNFHPVTARQIAWADRVVVMEESHKEELSSRFPKKSLQDKVVSLDIPDIYRFNNPALMVFLESKSGLLD
ncbi:phosphotyrosine protein phosphatase [Candidatus Woesearchaeota archaeon]|nr:phosphotyrosine protein phosphatase [Candidatus Woesearchaeota archaeon]